MSSKITPKRTVERGDKNENKENRSSKRLPVQQVSETIVIDSDEENGDVIDSDDIPLSSLTPGSSSTTVSSSVMLREQLKKYTTETTDLNLDSISLDSSTSDGRNLDENLNESPVEIGTGTLPL